MRRPLPGPRSCEHHFSLQYQFRHYPSRKDGLSEGTRLTKYKPAADMRSPVPSIEKAANSQLKLHIQQKQTKIRRRLAQKTKVQAAQQKSRAAPRVRRMRRKRVTKVTATVGNPVPAPSADPIEPAISETASSIRGSTPEFEFTPVRPSTATGAPQPTMNLTGVRHAFDGYARPGAPIVGCYSSCAFWAHMWAVFGAAHRFPNYSATSSPRFNRDLTVDATQGLAPHVRFPLIDYDTPTCDLFDDDDATLSLRVLAHVASMQSFVAAEAIQAQADEDAAYNAMQPYVEDL